MPISHGLNFRVFISFMSGEYIEKHCIRFKTVFLTNLTILKHMCGSPGLVGKDSRPKVMGSNPGTVYWMEKISHIFVVKIVMIFVRKDRKNEKEAGVGPFFKKKKQY